MNSTTILELFIEDGSIRAELEIGLSDVNSFKNLLPDELFQKLGEAPVPLAERLAKFFQSDFVIQPENGDPLSGVVKDMKGRARVKRDEITGEPLPPIEGEEPEGVVEVVIEYSLPNKPKSMVLKPPVDSATGRTNAMLGFVVYHRGLAVNDFRFLSGPEALDLDWEDPWYSSFRNRNLRRQFEAPAQGFIYVEHYEVRKELLLRPMDLQTFVDLGLEGKSVIAAGEQETLKEKIAEFLEDRCPMTIDGEPVDFELDRMNFVQRTLKKTSVIEEPQDLPVVSATLGIIYSHRRVGLPQTVTMKWDLFSDKITYMKGATQDEAGPLPWMVTSEDPELTWKNYLKNPSTPGELIALARPPTVPQIEAPVASVALVLILVAMLVFALLRKTISMGAIVGLMTCGIAAVVLWSVVTISVPNPFAAAEVNEKEASKVTADLLRNIYRAFDFKDEEDIYDSLDRSVSGELLTEIYVDVFEALKLQDQGGARVRVDAIEMLESTPAFDIEKPGFTIRCKWNVRGKVDHWGHGHFRVNQYEADFTVQVIDNAWKITRQEVVGSERVS